MTVSLERDLLFVGYAQLDSWALERLPVFLKSYEKRGQLRLWADPYIDPDIGVEVEAVELGPGVGRGGWRDPGPARRRGSARERRHGGRGDAALVEVTNLEARDRKSLKFSRIGSPTITEERNGLNEGAVGLMGRPRC
jgi:hypothetical protein